MNNCIPPAHEFQHRLRCVRLEEKWTGQTMANAIGISPAYYSDLERGRRLPSLRIADRCAELDYKRAHYDHTRDWFVAYWHTLAAKAHGWRI